LARIFQKQYGYDISLIAIRLIIHQDYFFSAVVIRLNISNLPINIKSIILNMMDLNPPAATNGNDLKSNDIYRIPNNITDSTVTWQTEDDVLKIKQKLKDALIRRTM